MIESEELKKKETKKVQVIRKRKYSDVQKPEKSSEGELTERQERMLRYYLGESDTL